MTHNTKIFLLLMLFCTKGIQASAPSKSSPDFSFLLRHWKESKTSASCLEAEMKNKRDKIAQAKLAESAQTLKSTAEKKPDDSGGGVFW